MWADIIQCTNDRDKAKRPRKVEFTLCELETDLLCLWSSWFSRLQIQVATYSMTLWTFGWCYWPFWVSSWQLDMSWNLSACINMWINILHLVTYLVSLSPSPSLFLSFLFLISVSFFSETGPQAHCVPCSASLVLGLPGSFLAGSPAAWRDLNH